MNSTLFESCCQPCSCRSTCTLVGNCCPDYRLPEDNYDVPLPISVCTNTLDLLNAGRLPVNNTRDYDPRVSYLVINKCPLTTNSSNETVALCSKPRYIRDYIPASSADGHMLFKNKHCAYCHGQYDLVFWPLLLGTSCASVLQRTWHNVYERDNYVIQNCILGTVPPAYKYAKMVRCRWSHIVSECESTGDLSNPELREKCDAPYAFYNTAYRQQGTKNIYYKNIFCYLCSSNSVSFSDICHRENDNDKTNIVPKHSLNILLEITEATQPSTDERKQCSSTAHVFDPYMVSYVAFALLITLNIKDTFKKHF